LADKPIEIKEEEDKIEEVDLETIETEIKVQIILFR